MQEFRLDGLRVLVLEDEFLIAMDVEQMCRERGASDVVIMRSMEEVGAFEPDGREFHAAVLDVMLGGHSTMDFAKRLRERGIPFVFATGYSETEDLFDALAGVEVVSKPYGAEHLIGALERAFARSREPSGGV